MNPKKKVVKVSFQSPSQATWRKSGVLAVGFSAGLGVFLYSLLAYPLSFFLFSIRLNSALSSWTGRSTRSRSFRQQTGAPYDAAP